MTIEEIQQLIDLVNQNGIAELEVERSGSRVRIRRAGESRTENIVLAPAPAPAAHLTAQAAPAPAPPPAAPPEAAHSLVKAPIVGTYYESPSPSSPAFVKVGDTVQPGQVLCIIESMKLMNEIEAETAGVIVAKLVENGRPVEYGEALFSIRPL